ncbi:MAG: ATP-binding protein [Clostridia bacterium]
MIKREEYLKKIRGFYDQDLIKVITGIRRSGKSTLLKQIIDELKESGVNKEKIIYINFEDIDMSFIKNDMDLNKYIKQKIKCDEKYYLFFDEIQNVIDWEKAVNSFKATKNVSIFITGSNSNFLSGELATLLAGRYVSFKIQPFSFREVCELRGLKDKSEIEKAFEDYIKWGGMPQRFYFKEEQEIKNYLMDLYDSIVVKDIITRYKVKDVELLNKILEYLMSTPAQQFSITNIVNYLKSENRNCSNETLYNYLSYITNSFIMNKAKRYDIKGKRVLSTNDKYYLTDLGLGQVKSSIKTKGKGSVLENIVYNELINRGYEVLVGKSDSSEIDFIASYFDEKIYVQVAYILADDDVIEREFGAFKEIQDNYPKYVLTMDKLDFSQNGIIHKNVIDWLLEK